MQLNSHEFYCECCNYNTTRKGDYIKHCSTRKHINQTKLASPISMNTNTGDINQFICSTCKRKYKDRSGLWRHSRNICYPQPSEHNPIKHAQPKKVHKQNTCKNDSNNFPISNDLIIEFIKQNQELKNILLEEREESRNRYNEQSAKIEELSKQTVVITNNHNNFNLNIFLNEKCKDAISMIDFVNSLQVDTCDVEYTGRYGYVEGITKIFIDGLKQLDIYKRPIHCTDLKRETLYIKEEKTWERDNNDKSKFKKAINAVVRKNMQQIVQWQEENPRCNILDSNEYVLHLNIMRQSLGGGNQEKAERNNIKIIKNIAKEVMINREQL
jgi:hypothetical protein